jgi:ATP-dependent DNA helicase RecG
MSEGRDRSALELLQELREIGEHERIEAKRGSSISHSVMETVCAFANEPHLGGGWILLGLEEDHSSLFSDFRVAGIADSDKLQNDLQSQCRSVFNAPVSVQMKPEKVEGKTLLKVFVSEAGGASKPIYFVKDGLPQGAFRRIGASDVHCTDEDLLALYEGRSTETYDGSVLPRAEMSDIDADVVEEYRRDRSRANANAEELAWSDEELLSALDCIVKTPNGWQPTVAGILLFGSKIALRRLFPMMRVDYIRVPGKDWIPDPEKRFDSLDMRDPLMRVARRAQSAILDDLLESFSLPAGQMQRETRRVIPERVIREAVVNAIMHRSYLVHSPIQIIRYSNRLEISNAGYSLKNEDHLGAPGSQPRNPKIAAVLHETHFPENKGSGIRVMRDQMREAGLTPPFFESDRANNKFTARFLFHHFLGEDDVRWLAGYKDFNLCDEDAKAMIYVREQGAISNAAYRDLNVTDTLTASKHLGRLRDCQLLEKKGKSTATYYIAGPKFLPLSTPALPEESGGLPPKLEGLPAELEGLPMEFGGLSMEFSALPIDLQSRVQSLGRRSKLQDVRELIVQLCAVHDWRLDELSILLKRNAVYLRNAHLTPLLAEGVLQRTHPETINHPQQAYRAAQSSIENHQS